MKKPDRLLRTLLITLSVYLLFRLFGNEEFNRLDYVLMVILALAGVISFIREGSIRKKEN
jgi:uncharacterized membrane protein YcaP (DUF421 family)